MAVLLHWFKNIIQSAMQNSLRLKVIVLKACLFFPVLAFSQFRVVGYVQPRGGPEPAIDKIPFQNITHLNIAFVNPDSTGNLMLPAGFDSLIQKAHEYRIKVLASIGGGNFNPYYSALISDSNRKSFITRLVNLVLWIGDGDRKYCVVADACRFGVHTVKNRRRAIEQIIIGSLNR